MWGIIKTLLLFALIVAIYFIGKTFFYNEASEMPTPTEVSNEIQSKATSISNNIQYTIEDEINQIQDETRDSLVSAENSLESALK